LLDSAEREELGNCDNFEAILLERQLLELLMLSIICHHCKFSKLCCLLMLFWLHYQKVSGVGDDDGCQMLEFPLI
jgi:hypothetical protein